jgi:peptidoglycan/xylan/chitin deacetylase (PgdA/CDA1 family)
MLLISTIVAALSASFLVQAAPSSLTERAPMAQVITKCTKSKTVALTFDDGPYSYLYEIADALKKAGGKGTFFFNGNNYGCIYSADNKKRVKYAYDQGHQIASHTWAHKDLATLTFDQLHDEMYRVEQALERITGVTPAFMRPPFGSYNNLVRQVALQRGQKVVNWDFDSGDSTGSTATQSNAAYDALIKRKPSTILALNHEVYEPTAHQVVPHAIAALKKAGYKMVTVAECLGEAPYQKVSKPQSGSWSC